jgi:anti-sigma-K factor RskA
MSTTPCSQRDLAVGWALHALEPEEEAAVAAHLPLCAECRDRVAETELTAALLGSATPQLDPPERLRASILAAARASTPARATPAAPAPAPVVSLDSRRARTPRRVLVAAAAAVVISVGGVAGWAGSQLGSTSSPAVAGAPADAVARDLATPGVQQVVLTAQGSTEPVAVLLAASDHDVVLPVAIPDVASGDSMWVWGVDPAGVPVPLGSVSGVNRSDVGSTALPVQSLPSARTSYARYALSVEPGQAVPTTPTTVVASGQVGA